MPPLFYFFLECVPIIFLFFIIFSSIAWIGQRSRSKTKRIKPLYYGIFGAYLACVFLLTCLPLPRLNTLPNFQTAIEHINYFPITKLAYAARTAWHQLQNSHILPFFLFLLNLIGNLVLLLPLAIFLRHCTKLKRFWILLIAFGSSLLIESIQLIFNAYANRPIRIVDIDDVILNTFGAAIFLFISNYKAWLQIRKNQRIIHIQQSIEAYTRKNKHRPKGSTQKQPPKR